MIYKIPEGSEGFFNGLHYKIGTKFERAYYWNGDEWMPSDHSVDWVRNAKRNINKKFDWDV